eukprot:COSAG02_NODE_2964_length_7645_cov_4.848927_4_plen_73_part_00
MWSRSRSTRRTVLPDTLVCRPPPAPAGAGAWSRAVTGLLAFIIYVHVQQRWWGVLVGHGMQGGHAGWWWECG